MNELRRLRLERLDDPQQRQDEHRREHRQQPDADAGRQADRQRRQHDAGILRIVDLRAVAHQPGGADDAERARQAGADHQHHDGADDGEDDLRLDDRRLALRRAAGAAGTRARTRGRRRSAAATSACRTGRPASSKSAVVAASCTSDASGCLSDDGVASAT